jgi:hypothetical protein
MLNKERDEQYQRKSLEIAKAQPDSDRALINDLFARLSHGLTFNMFADELIRRMDVAGFYNKLLDEDFGIHGYDVYGYLTNRKGADKDHPIDTMTVRQPNFDTMTVGQLLHYQNADWSEDEWFVKIMQDVLLKRAKAADMGLGLFISDALDKEYL